jgi:preprotein translocase subunit SecE
MEVKKTQQITSQMSKDVKELPVNGRQKDSRKIINFLSDVKSELYKISWTTPEELKTYTKIVIGATFCFGMGVYITDLMIQLLLGTLESTIRLIGG